MGGNDTVSCGLKQPFLVCMDEYHYYSPFAKDGLKDELRNLPGVPDVEYLVEGDRVFVFDKLVELASQHVKTNATAKLADVIAGMVNEAAVPLEEAVKEWRVAPRPYAVHAMAADEYRILHVPFDSYMPGFYRSKEEVNQALVVLLRGGVLPGEGGFTFRGQPMTLRQPLCTSALPPCPFESLKAGASGAENASPAVGRNDEQTGPLSPEMRQLVSNLMQAWRDFRGAVSVSVERNVVELWTVQADGLSQVLNGFTCDIPDYAKEDLAALRRHYPEMSMLSDAALYCHYDSYQSNEYRSHSWSPWRETGFFSYLIGVGVIGPEESAYESGTWIAYGLITGNTMSTAVEQAGAAIAYGAAISSLSHRVSMATYFLNGDAKIPVQVGSKVSTLQDLMRQSRSLGFAPVVCEQQITPDWSLSAT